METPIIRCAERADADSLLALITALADFEHLTPPDDEARARLIEHGFGDRPKFEAYLAEVQGAPGPVGYAFIFETYSTFLAKPTLYLEDLFVLPDYRKRGVGKALLNQHPMQLLGAREQRQQWLRAGGGPRRSPLPS